MTENEETTGKAEPGPAVVRGSVTGEQAAGSETRQYLDFEIEIGPGLGREYPLAVLSSPAGESRETFIFPFDEIALETRLKSLEIALLRSGGSRRQVLSSEEKLVQDFGRQLFSSLFSGETRTRYDMSSEMAHQQGLGLRIKLRIQAPELARLPWEFLYDPRQGEYVCMSRETPIVRYIELNQPIKPLKVELPLRILGMVASPLNLPVLDVEREKRRLEKAIAGLQSENLVNLTWLAAPTWRELQRSMRSGPWHIFHFIGHGGFDTNADEGVIAFEDENGEAQLLLATELGRLLSDHRSLRLTLLNACEGARASQHDIFSSSAAVLVRRGLPAVLAMQYAITDQAAIEFSRAFYEALSDGLPVDAAVCEARKAVSLAITNTIEWATPVLYMRSPQGIIFDLPQHTRLNIGRDQGPTSEDKELDARLERLYTEGRAAFWMEDWERACARFQSMLELRPTHAGAALALKEASQNRQRAALYARALEEEAAEKWNEAIHSLETLSAQAPDYKDAAARLQAVRQKKQVTDLYNEARTLHEANQWQAVVRVLEKLRLLQADYPDPDGLLVSAQSQIAAQKRQAGLDDTYRRSISAMDSGNWPEALALLEKLKADEPSYPELESLLRRARSEVDKTFKDRQAREQVDSLYEQAHGLARARQWAKVAGKLEEIRALDGAFADPDGLGAAARSALDQEEAEARHQSELAVMYAEAVRLLKAGQYQTALEKWAEIHTWDSKFPDRQKVQAEARKKLAALSKPAPSPVTRRLRKWQVILIGLVVLAAFAVFSYNLISTLIVAHLLASIPPTTRPGGLVPAAANPTLTPLPLAPGLRPTFTPLPLPQAPITEPTPVLVNIPGPDDNAMSSMFDNFNDPAFIGKYNPATWQIVPGGDTGEAAQVGGSLVLTQQGGDKWLVLNALGYSSVNITRPTFIETRLKLDQIYDGWVGFGVLNKPESVTGYCSIRGMGGNDKIKDYSLQCNGQNNRLVTFFNVQSNDWHIFRIEINPVDNSLTFFIDGARVGSDRYDLDFAKEKFTFYIYAWGTKNVPATMKVRGFIDYVRIGEIQAGPEYYDNFEDARFNGGFDIAKWKASGNVRLGKFSQDEGRLVMNLTGPETDMRLMALQTNFPPPTDKYTYVEVKARSVSGAGQFFIRLPTDKTPLYCAIDSTGGGVARICFRENQAGINVYTFANYPALADKDYIITFKFDPFARMIHFYFEDQKVASYNLLDGESLPRYLQIGLYGLNQGYYQASIDYVKIYSLSP